MSYQSEAQLENELIARLVEMGWEKVNIPNSGALKANLRETLGRFNRTTFSEEEFKKIMNFLKAGSIFEKAGKFRDRFNLLREDGSRFYLKFLDQQDYQKNIFQVTHQITQEGIYKNRYDVTLLLNGLPLLQVELKRRGLEMKEAFNQIDRYKAHTFWAGDGLFQFVELFVISNGANTKYFSNVPDSSFKQTFFWTDENNKRFSDLEDFTPEFFHPAQLWKMITRYIVLNQTDKALMVLRPYQVYAVERILQKVHMSRDNGYIWHTTGSGKTLTSFKASQLLIDLPEVDKVLFVVDRKDLDHQTKAEFNNFKADSVDTTDSTRELVKNLKTGGKLVLTTIQKLNNAISKEKSRAKLADLRDKRVVLIFDECHRSQFGETHQRIVEFFRNHQFFGFTGTPIFADNAARTEKGFRTTKDLFGECLHKYLIPDAIRDENVLRFSVEYFQVFRHKNEKLGDQKVVDIDTSEVFDSEERLEKVVDYIIENHDAKTRDRHFSALFACSKVPNAIRYYDLFKKKKEAGEHDLRVAAVFTWAANPKNPNADMGTFGGDVDETDPHRAKYSREKLDEIMADYNAMFGTSFNTRDSGSFSNYADALSKRMKDRTKPKFDQKKDRLDILIVVGMMLTGFDAKRVNTLYVDKNLQQHGLIQAFSRTNRILDATKMAGNILCFRNLKKATDDAIALFSNKDAKETVLLPEYGKVVAALKTAIADLLEMVPTHKAVDDLYTEEEELAFVKAFRQVIREVNLSKFFTDFSWDDLPISEQDFEDFKSKYLDLRDKVKRNNAKEKASILADIDFEVELLHQDKVDVTYIMMLLAQLKDAKAKDKEDKKKALLDLLNNEPDLRSKRELILAFIEEQLAHIPDGESIEEAFMQFLQAKKVAKITEIVEEFDLDQEAFRGLMDAYVFSGKPPIPGDLAKCLNTVPSIFERKRVLDSIAEKMKEVMEVFVMGMVG